MFKVHAVQAKFGDCLILEFGTPAKPRYVLVDGGPPQTFDDDLHKALQDIVGKGGKLDRVILSHIDNDHVVGLLDLFAALEDDDASGRERRVKVGGLWHNSFRKTIDPDGDIMQSLQMAMNLTAAAGQAMPLATDAFLGIKEGARLRTLAAQLKVKANDDFTGDLISVEKSKKAIKLGPLTLRIAGPTKKNLDELRKKWLAWAKDAEAKAASDPKTAANADKSVPNLSSIVILAQCHGKTLLLTGDARGDHIVEGLKAAKLMKNGTLHVDGLKVQHHGSDRNVTAKFFEKQVTADTYVISADGKYGNPDLPTLEWIVKGAAKAGRKITIVVTNETPTTRKLLQKYDPQTNGYELRVKPAGKRAITVDLA